MKLPWRLTIRFLHPRDFMLHRRLIMAGLIIGKLLFYRSVLLANTYSIDGQASSLLRWLRESGNI